jgi:nitrile hydratase subunit alpha
MAEHDHDHSEGSHLSEMDLRVRALETILVEKGYIETVALDRIVELYETKIGPHIGAGNRQGMDRPWVSAVAS